MWVSIIIVRYLELQSSGRKDEIRFHYTWISADGTVTVHTESFPYRLADYAWHKISLSVSGREIQVLIDCHPLYRRMTEHLPDRNFSASSNNMHLFVGQRNLDGQFALKVSCLALRSVTRFYIWLAISATMTTIRFCCCERRVKAEHSSQVTPVQLRPAGLSFNHYFHFMTKNFYFHLFVFVPPRTPPYTQPNQSTIQQNQPNIKKIHAGWHWRISYNSRPEWLFETMSRFG